MKLLTIILFIVLTLNLSATDESTPNNTIRGTVICQQTQKPVVGATVALIELKKITSSKQDGSFRFEKVSPGRYRLLVTFVGYDRYVGNIVHTSGKELIVNIEISESYIKADEVVVKAKKHFESINEAALVSSTMFTLDDVERFAGSRMDVARMASNFAGVASSDDNRNDIIIRGGSPTELLWRLDGLDIPNPNHFGTQGATGGPISAINQNLLDNSDFITGALPANYFDRMSGAFDLRTRRGNDEHYEFLGELGFNGFQLGVEGPIIKKKSSFIANYRYSFLDFLEMLGVDFGFSGIPRYQDGMFKLEYNPDYKNRLYMTGLFGKSDIYIQESKTEDVYTGDFDINNGTDLFSLGINWQHFLGERIYGRLLLGYVYNRYRTDLDSITTDEQSKVTNLFHWYQNRSTESYVNTKYELFYSPTSRQNFTFGIEGRYRFYKLFQQRFPVPQHSSTLWFFGEDGNATQLFSYINWNYHLSENLILDLGTESQYFGLNKKFTVEPRASLRWNLSPLHSIYLGYGLHRQSLPLVIYFYADGNENLDLMKSSHYVVGYNYILSEDALIKIESYYKDISLAPVEKNAASSYSFLNTGTNFGAVDGRGVELISKGLGHTYGAEFSLIKNFSAGYYITATASYVRQKYTGSDNIERYGAFDNIFIANILSGYELVISPKFSLEFSAKFTIAGGTPYTPIDLAKSRQNNRTYYNTHLAFSSRNSNYKRFDLRIDFRNHYQSMSVISYISFENLFDTKNVFSYQYDAKNKKIQTVYQLGSFFVGGVKIEF